MPTPEPLLVVVGANPVVAEAAAALPVNVLHMQEPGASGLGRRAWSGPGTRTAYIVDFQDPATLLAFTRRVLRPLNVMAVVSLTELGLEPAAVTAARLGVAGTALAAVRATRDKLRMRQILERHAPHLNPPFASGADRHAVARLFDGGAQVIAKPVDGVGSQSVTLLSSLAGFPPGRLGPATLFEGFVAGTEFSVEVLSRHGRHSVTGIAEKRTTAGFVELSHTMPAPSLDPAGEQLVREAVVELLDVLGVTDGPSHTEVKLDGGKVTVIETHTRLGGDGIADLVRLTTGVDWRRVAVGWPLDAEPPKPTAAAGTLAAATVFITAPPGRVTRVAAQPELAAGAIVQWDVAVRPGDTVAPLSSSANRLGHATVIAADAAACRAAVEEFIALRIVTTQ